MTSSAGGGAPVRPEDVEHIAELAKLHLSGVEAARLATELNQILEHVSILADADDSEPEAGVGTGPDRAPLRTPGQAPDPLLRAPATFAPAWSDGFFLVPRLPALGGRAPGEDGEG